MNVNRFPKHCYDMLKRLDDVERTCWATHIKQLLFSVGFGYVWIVQDIGDKTIFIAQFQQRLRDIYSQNWHFSVSSSSRCSHYQYFKTLLNTERYLNLNIPLKYK